LPEVSPAGCLIVLNSAGTPVETITNPDIAGPWDMALTSSAKLATLFVSNALTGTTRRVDGRPVSGTCTVVRLDLALEGQAPPRLASSTVIGTGYPWDANKAALVLAPTGLALARNGTLYVADAETDSVSAIPAALSRDGAPESRSAPLSSHGSLDAPLGMVIAPDGDIVVVNGNNGNAVEITPGGRQIATVTLVKNGAGDLFGLALAAGGKGILFVNDGTNSLDRYH
jgi:DNA-binding beta-propeller fold protein YncE